MKKTCLLISTKDKRRFLTHEKNLPSLIEFAKTFGAEIYKVKTESTEIMELKKLAEALCKQGPHDAPQHTKIRMLYPAKPAKKPRKNILKDAKKIKDFIKATMCRHKEVSLKELKKKYEGCGVTDACLCNHFSAVRKELIRDGFSIVKTGGGRYRLELRK